MNGWNGCQRGRLPCPHLCSSLLCILRILFSRDSTSFNIACTALERHAPK